MKKVRTAHARVRRIFYSDFHGETLCSKTGKQAVPVSTSLENAHGTQPATRKLLLGACVFARSGGFVAQQLNLKLPTRAEE